MIRNLIFILALLAFPVYGWSSPFSNPLATPQSSLSPKINIKPLVESNPASPGDPFRLYLSVEIEEGWHIYSLQPLAGNELLATQIILEDNVFDDGVEHWQESPVSLIQDDAQDRVVKGHRVTAEFHKDLYVPKNFSSGRYPINGRLIYRACDNKLCTLPKSSPFASWIDVGVIR